VKKAIVLYFLYLSLISFVAASNKPNPGLLSPAKTTTSYQPQTPGDALFIMGCDLIAETSSNSNTHNDSSYEDDTYPVLLGCAHLATNQAQSLEGHLSVVHAYIAEIMLSIDEASLIL